MEKRFREYLKHFEKLDYDVLSDEEIEVEKGNLQLKMAVLHQELVRILVGAMGFLICACIFLAGALASGNIICYILAALLGVCAAYMSLQYNGITKIIKKLDMFVDKLTLL